MIDVPSLFQAGPWSHKQRSEHVPIQVSHWLVHNGLALRSSIAIVFSSFGRMWLGELVLLVTCSSGQRLLTPATAIHFQTRSNALDLVEGFFISRHISPVSYCLHHHSLYISVLIPRAEQRNMDIRSHIFDAHHKDAIVDYPTFQPASDR